MASGKKIHQGYKSGMAGKEFKLLDASRIDYIDFNRKIIYELKPNNAKSIIKGTQQLLSYNKGMNDICKLVLVLY